MKVKLIRDSIVGVGKILRPDTEEWQGQAVKCGIVTELNTAMAGDVVNLSDADAGRLIQLGSAVKTTDPVGKFVPQKKAA